MRTIRRRIQGIACLIFFLPLGSAAHAQGAPSALDIARRIDDHYNRLHSLKAAFTETYDGLGQSRSESGVMLLRKPGKMRWEYASTPGKLFVLDGKFAWFYSPGQAQVQRIAASQLDDLRSPLRFLLGHTKIESELDSLNLAASSSSQFILTGIPKGLQKRIARLTITSAQDGTIRGIEIDETDGAKTTFSFEHEEPNPSLPETAFRFTPPPGVPVVDSLPPI